MGEQAALLTWQAEVPAEPGPRVLPRGGGPEEARPVDRAEGAEGADRAEEAEGARRSDRAEFEELFSIEYPRLLRALYLVTGSRGEAEELAQDTFVRAFERWELVRRAENRPGYLYRMALNLYRSRLRRMARAARRVVKPPQEPDPLQALDERDAIGRALASLSPGQREAVVMVEWLGMSHEEAGATLGISPITVRVRIHRARAVLRPLLRRGDE